MGVPELICSTALAELKRHSRVVIAVSGPQGSGKTTAAHAAAQQLRTEHAVAAQAVSLDDFYKPYADLQAVAARGNPLLQHRGLPGTHDTALATTFIHDFLAGRRTAAPVFDKSLHAGAGDRAGETAVPPQTQVVLIEGWMVGFRPVGNAEVARKAAEVAAAHIGIRLSLANLEEIDANLHAYLPIWDACAALVRLKPRSLSYVYKWRLDQEHKLIAEKGTGMTDDQVRRFVDQYVPAYILFNQTLDALPAHTVELGPDHDVVRVTAPQTA